VDEDLDDLTLPEFSQLEWLPCTNAEGLGDPDDGVPSAPFPVGRQHTFAWDTSGDLPGFSGQVLLRARPIDESRRIGPWEYRREPITLGD